MKHGEKIKYNFVMDTKKRELITEIQNLLNTHKDVMQTQIDPKLLEFMSEEELRNIIGSLLDQKEQQREDNKTWLEKFKQDLTS
jgi:hypothetical protein